MHDLELTRNFCVIAHIDHGKSTLADRLIQRCGGVSDRDFRDQILDSMDIERERGITIKSNTITLLYDAADGRRYRLNLIDTPGHVDFSHEVRRSLMSCEGALLLIDAAQGVEAQTVANLYLALEHDLEILPVINKIDLHSADIERVNEEIDADLGLDPFEAAHCSAKTGRVSTSCSKRSFTSFRLRPVTGMVRCRHSYLMPNTIPIEASFCSVASPRVPCERDSGFDSCTLRRSTQSRKWALFSCSATLRPSSLQGTSGMSSPESRTSVKSPSATRSPTLRVRRALPFRDIERPSRWCSLQCTRYLRRITRIWVKLSKS